MGNKKGRGGYSAPFSATNSILSNWRGVSGHGGGLYIVWRVSGLGGNVELWGLDKVWGKYTNFLKKYFCRQKFPRARVCVRTQPSLRDLVHFMPLSQG